ncbi:MAG: UDP-N-acetylmuramate--L-alanine ligase [Cyanobacteria bacterium P01_H01_bin.15]
MSKLALSGRPLHFIGIGGIGMSALAYVLAKRGLPVSGSDLKHSRMTERLEEAGVKVFYQQDASNFERFQSENGEPNAESTPQVICSTAISKENAEFIAAQAQGCLIFHRSDVLAALLAEYQGIAVAGTHGKTTTSSLIGYLLLHAGIEPTIVVGGEVDAWNGNARMGTGPYLVAEADESDGSLVKHPSHIGIITNIELDHPDHYTNIEQLIDIFRTFAANSEQLIGCVDCDIIREHFKPQITYGLSQPADYTARHIDYGATYTNADIYERDTYLGPLKLPLLGKHNLSNALAAIAVGRLLGLEFASIAAGLLQFSGAKRRFEVRGETNGITFVDDYAHHPSEIRATLAAARQWSKHERRLVAVFQPHRYSRTVAFLAEFAQSFAAADLVIVTDIYGAGETNRQNVSGKTLADEINQHYGHSTYHPAVRELPQFLEQILQSGDLVLFLGAGNLNQVIPDVITRLEALAPMPA